MRPGLPQFPSRAHGAGLVAFVTAPALACVAPWLAALPLAAFVLACMVAPYFPTWSFFLPTTVRGPRSRREVAITFDDGPDPRTLGPLLDLLAREGVPATFFVVGQRAAALPDLVPRLLAAGHEIGNHSQSHDPFLMLRSVERLRREVVQCQEVLGGAGVVPLVFRPPVGITNPRLLPVLESLHLRCVAFSCRPVDFANRRMHGLCERVLRRVRPGDIVLLHDTLPPSVPVSSWLEEVAAILRGLRARGLSVVPLSRLIGSPVMRPAAVLTGEGRPAAAATATPAIPLLPRAGDSDAERGSLLGALGAAAQMVFMMGYPVLVLASVARFGARKAALLLLVFLALGRLRSTRRGMTRARGTFGLWVAVAVLLLLAAWLDDTRYMLAYPSLVNAVLLAQFAWSLRSGYSMAERFARMEVQDLTAKETRYCRTVTLVWCAFFSLNGSAATGLALRAPHTWWGVYTGCISYVLVGLLFAAEYLVRKARFGRYGRGPVDRLLARFFGNAAVSS